MSREILGAGLVGQQQHEFPAGAHFVLLAGVGVTALVLLVVNRWWRRRDAVAAEEQAPSSDRSAKNTSFPKSE